ncbi:hypothetical protein I302_109216 [Kwoniella bestiolae CBS 10118]|uniref:Sulfotransferase domain-containing protein n=1 Tax=Kwoniella bestiolae CBS 10118 TaxID=1296100 RepID=A0AAJ8KH20_9TREE
MWVSLSSMGIGLLTSYTMYGYLQEKIMSKSHDGVRFQSTVLLVAFNHLAGIAAAIYMQRCRHGNSLRPRHPVYAYAPVSLFNFASTLCQYEALKYVSFTTQTLGASSKMVPVVLLGKLVCGKQYKWRNLLAVGLVTLGVTLYMTTTYDFTSESRSSTLRGLLLLAGYLIFDGLVSTTETVLFQKSQRRSALQNLGTSNRRRSEPKVELVYDQILWTNICSLGVSIIVVLIDHKRSFGHLLDMLKMPSAYQLISDITLLSLSASIGLIFLLTTIATFGALTCGTMTSARPFLSIFINSAAFRTGRHLGIGGWIGIGFVGSAVYLELAHECEAKDKDHGLSSSRTTKRNARQHVTKTVIGYFAFPIIGGLIAHILSTVLIPANGALLVSKMFPTGPSFAYRNQTYSREDIRRLSKKADCPDQSMLNRTAYATPIPRTVLASFPRSGNTLTRELVEHSTGFHTVDAKCGHAREMSYFSEGCKYPDNNFLVKDHVPEYTIYAQDDEAWRERAESYDRVVQVIRNPLDAIWSYWHLMRSRMDHKKRIEGIDILGLMNLSELDRMAQNWVQHTDYWTSTDRPKVLLRYEDLRGDDQIQHLARVLQMLLPADQLPPIERLICADDDRAVAYQSRKAEPFYSWDHFSPEVRSHILSVVKGNWCALGYETILRKQRGHMGIDCD